MNINEVMKPVREAFNSVVEKWMRERLASIRLFPEELTFEYFREHGLGFEVVRDEYKVPVQWTITHNGVVIGVLEENPEPRPDGSIVAFSLRERK